MITFQRNARKCKLLLQMFVSFRDLTYVSIYTTSDLGDLSHLIGSLSRTIEQYSPPREWNNV